MEMQMGIQIPYSEDGEESLSPEMEMQISRMAVPVAQQLLNQNQTAIAAQQAQQAAQDPIVQMQMKELQLKEQDNQRKVAKDQADNAIKTAQQQIERERIQAQTATDDKRIKMDAVKTAVQMSASKEQYMMDKGVDILKQLSNKSHEEQLRQMQERVQMRQQNKPTKGE
jgi:hypothetical protein